MCGKAVGPNDFLSDVVWLTRSILDDWYLPLHYCFFLDIKAVPSFQSISPPSTLIIVYYTSEKIRVNIKGPLRPINDLTVLSTRFTLTSRPLTKANLKCIPSPEHSLRGHRRALRGTFTSFVAINFTYHERQA